MTTHLRLVVDLELDTTPISGRLSTPTDRGRAFHGWLELASAIEAVRNAAITAQQSPRDD